MVASKKITNWIDRNDVHALIEHRLENLGIRCQNTDWHEKRLVALTMVPNLVSSSEAPTTANDGAERNNSFLLSTSRDAFDTVHNPDTTKSRANIEIGEGICRGFELPRVEVLSGTGSFKLRSKIKIGERKLFPSRRKN
jgi:hypothetical protein